MSICLATKGIICYPSRRRVRKYVIHREPLEVSMSEDSDFTMVDALCSVVIDVESEPTECVIQVDQKGVDVISEEEEVFFVEVEDVDI